MVGQHWEGEVEARVLICGLEGCGVGTDVFHEVLCWEVRS